MAQGASIEDYSYWEPMLFEATTVCLVSDYYFSGDSPDDVAPQAQGTAL